MRSEISDDWPKLLPFIVNALNHKPIKALGNKSPSEINSEWDDVKIREAQKKNKIKVYHEPNWETQNQNQKTYLQSKKILQPGSYVYVDKKTEVFNKSFFAQVRLFFLLLKNNFLYLNIKIFRKRKNKERKFSFQPTKKEHFCFSKKRSQKRMQRSCKRTLHKRRRKGKVRIFKDLLERE